MFAFGYETIGLHAKHMFCILKQQMFRMQRLTYVLIPGLPIQVERLRLGSEFYENTITPDVLGGESVYAASGSLYEAGIRIGMSLAQVKQIAPYASIIRNDETAYHAVHDKVVTALKTFSPSLETIGLGQIILNIRGLDKVWSDEAELAQAISDAAIQACGLQIQVGIADGKFVAEQAAYSAPTNGTCIVPAGTEAQFLSPLPIFTLPYVRDEIQARLHLLGIDTLGDFARLTQAAVTLQFGPEAAVLHNLAQGKDRRLFQPDTPPLRIRRAIQLEDPTSDLKRIFNALGRLTQKLSRALQQRGYHTEALKLSVEVSDGQGHQVNIPLERGLSINPPTADASLLERIAQHLFARLAITSPVTCLWVCAYPLRSWSLDAHQQTLLNIGLPERDNKLELVIETLLRRFGKDAIKIASLIRQPLPVPIKVMVNTHGLPVVLYLRDGRQPIFGIDEHWRMEPPWWNRRIRRDYFRVILMDGSLRVIFRNLNTGGWFIERSYPLR